MNFIMDKKVHSIARGKSFERFVLMFVTAFSKIGCDSNVKSAVSFAGENVDIAWLGHGVDPYARYRSHWIPAFAGMT